MTSHPITAYARTAYAQGWAASGGPMTSRVKAGCAAAIAYAIDHANRHGVLEVTLRLGHLEGVWAAVYERRERLHQANEAATQTAWKTITAGLDLAPTIYWFRASAGLSESRISDAVQAVTGVVRRALGETGAWPAFVDTIRDGITKARAEGVTDALALAAEHRPRESSGPAGFDFDIAFTDAYDALAHLEGLKVAADGWADRIAQGAMTDLGRSLSSLAENGGSYEDMLDAAGRLLTSGDSNAVAALIDLATSQALSQGALNLYVTEGVQEIEFLTAGDASVCKVCQDAEEGNPYPLSNAPQPGLHPRCRCAITALSPLSPGSYGRYLPEEA